MTQLEPASEQLVKPGKAARRANVQAGLWSVIVLAPAALALVALFGFLLATGVDISWAVGRTDWVAPPGAKVAGIAIGAKNFQEVNAVLSTVEREFASLKVWLVENPSRFSVADGIGSVSTAGDEFSASVSACEFGFRVDVDTMREQIAELNEVSHGFLSAGHRIRMWNDPPQIPVALVADCSLARRKLEELKRAFDREPVNARIDLRNRQIIPSRGGAAIDIDNTLASLPLHISRLEDFPVRVVVRRAAPEVNAEDFDEIDIENPLARYMTRFNTSKVNRSRNIEMVAAHFEGVTIGAGEVFSFNRTTGPRTAAEGYLPAPMYRNRRIELSPAGGACQVSTTLYNAALLAGMEIVERHPHSRPCPYVPYGRDAAVAYDSGVDLKFRNTLAHPVVIHQEVDRTAGTILFEIYGHPDDRVTVTIHNAYSWIPRPESSTTYIVDTSLAPGQQVVDDEGCNGIVQRVWRVWYDSQGNKVRTEDLSSDRLSPVGRVIRYNPAPGSSGPPDENPPAAPGQNTGDVEAPPEEPPEAHF